MKNKIIKALLIITSIFTLNGIGFCDAYANNDDKNSESSTTEVLSGESTTKTAEEAVDNLDLGGPSVEDIVKKVTKILLWIIGIASVIMIIVGGLRYVLSGGAPDKVSSAKNTITYAVVGLIIALVAYAIVEFVIKVFSE